MLQNINGLILKILKDLLMVNDLQLNDPDGWLNQDCG